MKKIFVILCIIGISIIDAKAIYCKDFDTQAEAQKYFIKYNAKRLDRDKDGEACECLWGGSAYDTSSCRYWRVKNGKFWNML